MISDRNMSSKVHRHFEFHKDYFLGSQYDKRMTAARFVGYKCHLKPIEENVKCKPREM